MQSELLRNHQFKTGLATIHKVLKNQDVKPIIINRKSQTLIGMQFPIQRFQTDCGTEFFAEKCRIKLCCME
jgi:hypothetical protein